MKIDNSKFSKQEFKEKLNSLRVQLEQDHSDIKELMESVPHNDFESLICIKAQLRQPICDLLYLIVGIETYTNMDKEEDE